MPKKYINKAAAGTTSSSTSIGGITGDDDGEEQSSLPTSESQKPPKRGKRAAAADETKRPPAATKRKYTKKQSIDTKQYDYLNDIDSLGKIRSAKVCANRWCSILMARDNRKRAITNNNNKDANETNVDVMFDCSDLIIPPTAELLEREAQTAIEKWKALDSRVIKTDFDDIDGKSDGGSVDGSHKSVGGRPIKEPMLPPNFDYQCRQNKPPSDEQDDNNNNSDMDVVGNGNSKKSRKRVISLLDPTQTLDYESELWKVFKSMPTVKEVEQQYALGSSDEVPTDGDHHDNTTPPPPPVNHGCQHTLTIKNTLEKLRRKYTRIDAHSLGRLRIRDRHSSLYNYSGEEQDVVNMSNNNSSVLQTTVRFEILKPNVEDLRRGSGPDGNRLEVELHGSQRTLLDLHHTLIELASVHVDGGGADIPAGVFVIEDVLYTHGDIGKAAADSISEEFNSKQCEKKDEVVQSTTAPDDAHDEKVQSKLKMLPMDEIKLQDLTLRLGVRYTHINLQSSTMESNISWDQSCISALFITGIQCHPTPCSLSAENGEKNNEQSNNNRVPIIIHDIWTSSQQSHTHYMCAACNYLPATVAVVNDMLTDASLTFPSSVVNSMGTPLCASCFRELHYQSDDSGNMLQLRPNRSELKVFPIAPVDRSG